MTRATRLNGYGAVVSLVVIVSVVSVVIPPRPVGVIFLPLVAALGLVGVRSVQRARIRIGPPRVLGAVDIKLPWFASHPLWALVCRSTARSVTSVSVFSYMDHSWYVVFRGRRGFPIGFIVVPRHFALCRPAGRAGVACDGDRWIVGLVDELRRHGVPVMLRSTALWIDQP